MPHNVTCLTAYLHSLGEKDHNKNTEDSCALDNHSFYNTHVVARDTIRVIFDTGYLAGNTISWDKYYSMYLGIYCIPTKFRSVWQFRNLFNSNSRVRELTSLNRFSKGILFSNYNKQTEIPDQCIKHETKNRSQLRKKQSSINHTVRTILNLHAKSVGFSITKRLGSAVHGSLSFSLPFKQFNMKSCEEVRIEWVLQWC